MDARPIGVGMLGGIARVYELGIACCAESQSEELLVETLAIEASRLS